MTEEQRLKPEAIENEEIAEASTNEELDSLKEDLSNPERLKAQATELFQKNKVKFDALFKEEEKTETMKANIISLIKSYIGNPDGYELEREQIRFETTGDNDPHYTSGQKIIRIPNPEEQNQPVDIFFGGTKEMIINRATRSRELQYKIKVPGSNPEVKLDTIISDPNKIPDIIKTLHLHGSYLSFKYLLESSKITLTTENLKPFLDTIRSFHSDNSSQIDHKREKENKYYRTIAEHITEKNDLTLIDKHTKLIRENLTYLGNNSRDRIDTRNIIGKRGENNSLSPDMALRFSEIKQLTDPRTQKDIISLIQGTYEQFAEKYGPLITKFMDMLGGKGLFMQFLIPKAFRKQFLDFFKQRNQLNDDQEKNFNDLSKSLEGLNRDQLQKNTKPPSKRLENIIKDLQESESESEKTNIKNSLLNNFVKLSPRLIYNIITDYNKGREESEQISPGTVVDIENNKVVSIKGDIDDDNKEKIINHLLGKDSTMRKSIKSAHNRYIDQTDYKLGEDTMNINGSQEPKGIGSFFDLGVYISAYVITGGDPDFHSVISENDRVKTTTQHTTSTSKTTPEPAAETTATETAEAATEAAEDGAATEDGTEES